MKHRRTFLGLTSVAFVGAMFNARKALAKTIPVGGQRKTMADKTDSEKLSELYDEMLIKQLFVEYLQAVGKRDGATVQAYFAPDAWVKNFTNKSGEKIPGATPIKGSDMGEFTSRSYHPYKPGVWSHILNTDHVIKLNGNLASYLAQVFYVYSYQLTADGTPLTDIDVVGGKHAGRVELVNSGLYEADLKKIDGQWKISELRITVDLPYIGAGAKKS